MSGLRFGGDEAVDHAAQHRRGEADGQDAGRGDGDLRRALAPIARCTTSAPVRAVVVLGDRIAAGLASGDVELFRTSDLGPAGRFHAHDGAIHDMCAAGTGLATAGEDGFARRFDVTGRELARVDHGCFVSAIRPLRSGWFVTGAYDGLARIIELAHRNVAVIEATAG